MNNDYNNDILSVLQTLIENWENEIVEFKEANNDYDKEKIGQYFSAISNEANLNDVQYGWLIFGIRNKDKEIVGTNYRENSEKLNKLKQEISQNTTDGITFIDIFEVITDKNKRVIMFQIPAAATGLPTGWNNHFYGRNGESLTALSISEQDRIRGQVKLDWSKQVLDNATIECLDKQAIKIARNKYREKMNRPHIIEEIDNMSDVEFLTKIKLIINGKITNTAMLLLGNEDFDYLFNSAPEISWRLYDSTGDTVDYEIFKIPFITVSDRLFSKLRNLTYRYMPSQQTLFPKETKQYDNWLLRELMNNCIAHSDYTIGGRIYLNEFEDKLIISNPGKFLPGSIEPVLNPSYNPPFYKNQLLAETMVKLNMIDTVSMGIRKAFKIQKDKYFPLPDYDLSNFNRVIVTVYGKILDDNYSKILFDNPNFDLTTVYLIDCIQKNKKLTKEQVSYLRQLNVIEGRFPNVYISAKVAETMNKKAEYVKNKGLEDSYYKKLIVEYIGKFGQATRSDIRKLLIDKLPDSLSQQQKEDKIKNLIQSMKKGDIIKPTSSNTKKCKWELV